VPLSAYELLREGRCNIYRIHPELAIGDPVVEEQSLREFVRLIGKGKTTTTGLRASPSPER